MDAPRMSACIVAYCDYEEVCAAVRSVLTHTPAADFRLFVVDNASPDGCAAILAEYAARDARVRVVTHARNEGLFRARLSGVRAARGAYIAFVDSDDYVSRDFFRELAENAQENGSDIVVGRLVHEDEKGYRYLHNTYDTYDFGTLEGQAPAEKY